LYRRTVCVLEGLAHTFLVFESLIEHACLAHRRERFYREWPGVDLPAFLGSVLPAQQQVHLSGRGDRDSRESEFVDSTTTKFQRKEVPNSDQVPMIREDLRRNGLFEKRILSQRTTGVFLVFSLLPEKLRSFTQVRIGLALMKSLAESIEMKRDDQ